MLQVWGQRWARTSPADAATIFRLLDFTQSGAGPSVVYAVYLTMTVAALSAATAGMWFAMRWWAPATPTTHLAAQVRTIAVNMVLLGLLQTLADMAAVAGLTKQYVAANPSDLVSLRCAGECGLWMVAFELAWYCQHRAMHDSKTLWAWGHSYHHSWRRPEHMIGITNFAFDHVVEVRAGAGDAIAFMHCPELLCQCV